MVLFFVSHNNRAFDFIRKHSGVQQISLTRNGLIRAYFSFSRHNYLLKSLTRLADARLTQYDHFDRLGVLVKAQAPTRRTEEHLLGGGRRRHSITIHVLIATASSAGCPIDYEPSPPGCPMIFNGCIIHSNRVASRAPQRVDA